MPAQNHTVTFQCDTSVTDCPQPATVANGQKATAPAAHTAPTGKTFSHWCKTTAGCEKANEFSFDTVITEDITLVAEYKDAPQEEYDVTFDCNGGTNCPATPVKTWAQTVLEPDDPTAPTGKTFSHWCKDAAPCPTAFDFSTRNAEDITLVAEYKDAPQEYDVTFDCNGGTGCPATPDKTQLQKVTKPADPTAPTGKTFSHWCKDTAPCPTAFDFDAAVSADVKLVAEYITTENVAGGALVVIVTSPAEQSGIKFEGCKKADGTQLTNAIIVNDVIICSANKAAIWEYDEQYFTAGVVTKSATQATTAQENLELTVKKVPTAQDPAQIVLKAPAPVAQFSITPAAVTVEEDKSTKLTVNNQPANTTLEWDSLDKTIATVDANGEVTGVKESATPVTITATAKSATGTEIATATATVTVTAKTLPVPKPSSSSPVPFPLLGWLGLAGLMSLLGLTTLRRRRV